MVSSPPYPDTDELVGGGGGLGGGGLGGGGLGLLVVDDGVRVGAVFFAGVLDVFAGVFPDELEAEAFPEEPDEPDERKERKLDLGAREGW